jgi:hypothetical protein
MTKLATLAVGCIALFGSILGAVPQTDRIKITFSRPSEAPPPFGGGLPRNSSYPPGHDSREHGAFANIVAGNISGVKVTWADPERFKTEAETEALLRELLSSPNTTTWAYHAWSQLDGFPSVVATIEHRKGKEGRWVVWCPGPNWAYQDENGKWWWSTWQRYKDQPPKSCEDK